MKQSLSGVWKAYVMQTMNGQSEICYHEREIDGKNGDGVCEAYHIRYNTHAATMSLPVDGVNDNTSDSD